MDSKGNLLPGEITALMASKTPVDPFVAQMLLREAYEIDFGICDHRLPANQTPMALVRMNPKEDPCTYSTLYETLRRYVKYEIREHFGYTPEQFLALPRERVQFMFKLAMEKLETKSATVDGVVKKLEDQINGKRGKP